MPAIIRATTNRSTGFVSLRFAYDAKTIAALKAIPGPRWDADGRCWIAPLECLGLLRRQLTIEMVSDAELEAPLLYPDQAARLRSYQVEAAQRLVRNPGYLLTFDMRTGKTPTAIVAATAMLGQKFANTVVVLYPNIVAQSWERHFNEWAGMSLHRFEGHESLGSAQIAWLRRQKWTVVGCHWEILAKREEDLRAVTDGRLFVLIADEIHMAKNTRAGRSKALSNLVRSPWNVARWGLSGTPMRNRPRDVFALFDFVTPNGMTWKRFAERYCGRQLLEHGSHRVYNKDGTFDEVPGHWDDNGRSNEEELAERLRAISYRLTRADVAAWLPKSERSVIFCNASKGLTSSYRKLEAHFASKLDLANADESGSGKSAAALKALTEITSEGKIPSALMRIAAHVERGVKLIVFCHYHETFSKLKKAVEGAKTLSDVPFFFAPGTESDDKRKLKIAEWQGAESPAVLFATTLSAGIGIDLSDAEVAIFLELEWVPADFRQAEDRLADVHLGKRKTPPIYEYLLMKDTIDEAVAHTILTKVSAIEAVVGRDAETSDVANTLRDSGVIGSGRLSLPDTSTETVTAALLSIRDRWMRDERADGVTGADAVDLVGEAISLPDDEEETESDDEAEAN